MVSLMSLWIPILLSAVIVFVASSIMHMLLSYHKSDMGKIAKEDEAIAALRPLNIPPGDYFMPHADSMKAMKDPVFLDKMKAGPVVYFTVLPSAVPSMGPSLVLWFLYSVLVSVIAAYVASHALRRGANYLEVFRFVGCVSFTGYALALLQNSIWYKRNWGTTLKYIFDGLVYGLLTAGTFGWLWPR
jgi:hypothetical protein